MKLPWYSLVILALLVSVYADFDWLPLSAGDTACYIKDAGVYIPDRGTYVYNGIKFTCQSGSYPTNPIKQSAEYYPPLENGVCSDGPNKYWCADREGILFDSLGARTCDQQKTCRYTDWLDYECVRDKYGLQCSSSTPNTTAQSCTMDGFPYYSNDLGAPVPGGVSFKSTGDTSCSSGLTYMCSSLGIWTATGKACGVDVECVQATDCQGMSGDIVTGWKCENNKCVAPDPDAPDEPKTGIPLTRDSALMLLGACFVGSLFYPRRVI